MHYQIGLKQTKKNYIHQFSFVTSIQGIHLRFSIIKYLKYKNDFVFWTDLHVSVHTVLVYFQILENRVNNNFPYVNSFLKSSAMGQTALHKYICSQWHGYTVQLSGEHYKLKSMARAQGSLDGIRGHLSVTKSSLQDGHQLYDYLPMDGIRQFTSLCINEYRAAFN